MIPVKFVVEELIIGILLVMYSTSYKLSALSSQVVFTSDDYRDHPDRENVGEIACEIVDGIFAINEVYTVVISSGQLVISASRREFWWSQHKEEVSQVLRTALKLERINFIEGA